MIHQQDAVAAVPSVEGNEGFAMPGDWSDIGPAEFEPVHRKARRGTEAWNRAAREASEMALRRLQPRFPETVIRGEWQSPQ